MASLDEMEKLANMMETDVLTVHESNNKDTVIENIDANDYDEYDEYMDGENDENIELSPDGILDEETIGRGLSNLGRSADGMHQVYLHLSLPGFGLVDIGLMKEYVYLQKVELPHNQLDNLSVLDNLPYLLILDVSHNKLTSLLDFIPPKNLQEIDFSYNEINYLTDLSAHHSLKKINLSYNNIEDIFGLSNCKRLIDLNLSHNRIKSINGLDDLPIQLLDLSHNQITVIENLDRLKHIRECTLSGNQLISLSGLEHQSLLESIDLEANKIGDIQEIMYLTDLKMLRNINLHQNPIQELPEYRLSLVFYLQSLTELDKHKVGAEEKVRAKNMFDPPAEVIASRDHIMNVVYSFLQPSRVQDTTLPSKDTPYPLLTLVGPQGSGKKDLALKLVDEFSSYFGFGVSHTTRTAYRDERDGIDYYFTDIERFETDIKMGKFLQTHQQYGDWYGLQMESIQSVARNGLACVVQTEIEGVLGLKNTHFESRYVLILPMDRIKHKKKLTERKIFSEEQIEDILNTGEKYCEYNQNNPGFFDMMINSDNIEEAYTQLRKLILEYLGIGSSVSPIGDGESSYKIEDHFPPPPSSGQNVMTRTWSKPSFSDNQNGQILTGRGIVEEESFKRRLSAAKDVVSGYTASLYEQLLENCPRTAPTQIQNQIGLGDDSHRFSSAPVKNRSYFGGMDSPSSSESNGSCSNLSDIGSATGLREVQTLNEQQQFMDDHNKQISTDVNIPHPPISSRPDSQNSQRLNPHKVLPAIQPSH